MPDVAALPPGWEEHTDVSYKRSYYCHTATGRVQWQRPLLSTPPGGETDSPGNVATLARVVGAVSSLIQQQEEQRLQEQGLAQLLVIAQQVRQAQEGAAVLQHLQAAELVERLGAVSGDLSPLALPTAPLLPALTPTLPLAPLPGPAECLAFCQRNGVDAKAAAALMELPADLAQLVLARGDLRSARNPSSTLTQRVRDALSGRLPPGGLSTGLTSSGRSVSSNWVGPDRAVCHNCNSIGHYARDCLRPKTCGWVCDCGFKNRAVNNVCGGTGPMGCKKERPLYGDAGPPDAAALIAPGSCAGDGDSDRNESGPVEPAAAGGGGSRESTPETIHFPPTTAHLAAAAGGGAGAAKRRRLGSDDGGGADDNNVRVDFGVIRLADGEVDVGAERARAGSAGRAEEGDAAAELPPEEAAKVAVAPGLGII